MVEIIFAGGRPGAQGSSSLLQKAIAYQNMLQRRREFEAGQKQQAIANAMAQEGMDLRARELGLREQQYEAEQAFLEGERAQAAAEEEAARQLYEMEVMKRLPQGAGVLADDQYDVIKQLGVSSGPQGSVTDMRAGVHYDDPFEDPRVMQLYSQMSPDDQKGFLASVKLQQDEARGAAMRERLGGLLMSGQQQGMFTDMEAQQIAALGAQDPAAALKAVEEKHAVVAEEQHRVQGIEKSIGKMNGLAIALQEAGQWTPAMQTALINAQSALSPYDTRNSEEVMDSFMRSMNPLNEQMARGEVDVIPLPMAPKAKPEEVDPGTSGIEQAAGVEDAPDALQQLIAAGQQLNAAGQGADRRQPQPEGRTVLPAASHPYSSPVESEPQPAAAVAAAVQEPVPAPPPMAPVAAPVMEQPVVQEPVVEEPAPARPPAPKTRQMPESLRTKLQQASEQEEVEAARMQASGAPKRNPEILRHEKKNRDHRTLIKQAQRKLEDAQEVVQQFEDYMAEDGDKGSMEYSRLKGKAEAAQKVVDAQQKEIRKLENRIKTADKRIAEIMAREARNARKK